MTTAQGTNPTNDEGAEGEIVPEAFSEYREHEPETPGVHDESVTDDAELRPDYAAVIERIETLGPDEVSRRLEAAGKGLTELGVTINSEDGNRPYPIDIVPRIISAERWAELSAGAEQRVRALELFLRDVYGPGEIIKAGRVDADMLRRSPGWSKDGQRVPADFVRAGICGLDPSRPRPASGWCSRTTCACPAGSA